ncbi:uncharacterized protein BP01DRAFT_360382 [Aspergillus saccharolyticus JOP 1030-1]|uniref:Retrovirus-related Pol polyprotein from transposon TNT 1-94-like beta-barrel domain-containing protein n=1 Tax=Aspergillus saccharolyticus JOP 1030-1 TaxID=1450539 RepID=A0A318ZMJ7_9EURO|nr:hypothetical protein BP01DRAFT_360382 [Aspergillus saccharolyticus JOP 1030-1]PYH41408.1 hypothetical protein BP01DRAFT_360382 [Aspergillus saccharolyticus JOP 1030-1]
MTQHHHHHYRPYHHQHPTASASPTRTNSNSNSKPARSSRKSRKQEDRSSASQRCWDWLLLPSSSNTHFAKNRASFCTYRRAPCKIANQRVLGVGTVQLRVRRAPNDPRTTTLVLHDVLHMPHARCNGISVTKFTEDFDCAEGCRGGEARRRRSSGGSVGDTLEFEGRVEVGVEGVGEAEHLQVRRASTSTISSYGGGGGELGDRDDLGEGLWFADGRPERGCSRVVLAGEHQKLDVGDLENEQMLKGLVISKEELELLNERVRNRSWV